MGRVFRHGGLGRQQGEQLDESGSLGVLAHQFGDAGEVCAVECGLVLVVAFLDYRGQQRPLAAEVMGQTGIAEPDTGGDLA
ncbi:hypothetical protein [Streptomyces vastus]|uniref:Uncharacterized protein n=1 Tax=Streptomyces vastus TaxID=285451 RepID=A0ABN3QCJ9_9ACTN